MLKARLITLLDEKLIVLADDLCLDLHDITRLTSKLHQAHVTRAELRIVLLCAVVPHPEDVTLTQRWVQRQAQLGCLDAGLEQ